MYLLAGKVVPVGPVEPEPWLVIDTVACSIARSLSNT